MPAAVQIITPARPAWLNMSAVAFAMLPRWARQLYGTPGLPATDLLATAAATVLRRGLLTVPRPLRISSHRHAADRRLK